MPTAAELRFGSVPYLNARPLLAGLLRDGRDVRLLVPSMLTKELRSGRLDVALVPVIAGFEDPTLVLVPGGAVASRGPVESVLLFTDRRPEDCRTVGLDTSSRTSANLTRVLFRDLWRGNPVFRPRDPDPDVGIDPSDAVLLIGDPALKAAARAAAAGRTTPPVDLGRAWTDWTGLPFVFAAWHARSPEIAEVAAPLVAESRSQGLSRIADLAADGARELGLDPAATGAYLRESLVFEFGNDEQRGLARFRERWSALPPNERS